MRGGRGGVPPKSHPGGGAGLSLPPWCCVQRAVCIKVWLVGSHGAMTACHRLRGGNLGCPSVVPACRRHPGRRNTGLRTAATPHGVAKMSASGYRLHRCGGCARWWAVRCSASQSRCAEAAPDGKPRSGVPDRNPALTQLCRGLEMAPTTACRRYAPVAPGCVKARLKSRLCSEMPFPPAMWLYLCDISLHAMWRMRCHKGNV